MKAYTNKVLIPIRLFLTCETSDFEKFPSFECITLFNSLVLLLIDGLLRVV